MAYVVVQRSRQIFSKFLFKKTNFLPLQCSHYCLESNDNSVSALIKIWENKFTENEISEPSLSIRHIMVHLLQLPGITCIPDVMSNVLTSQQLNSLHRMCECRLSRMPVQYIIGEWDFRDFTVHLNPPVFIPRPETEQLVELVEQRLIETTKTNGRILEIGCGSGIISLSLLKTFPQIQCVAVDKCKFACLLTLKNAKSLELGDRLLVHHGKLCSGNIIGFNMQQKFHFIVSNPPYIPKKDISTLQPEITLYEDIQALDGGTDGLQIIEQILQFAPLVLNPEGRIFLEVDPTHPEMIQNYLTNHKNLNLQFIRSYEDFTKRNRFVEIQCITDNK